MKFFLNDIFFVNLFFDNANNLDINDAQDQGDRIFTENECQTFCVNDNNEFDINDNNDIINNSRNPTPIEDIFEDALLFIDNLDENDDGDNITHIEQK